MHDSEVEGVDDWDPLSHLASLTDEELWAETMSGLVESAAIISLAVVLTILIIYRRQRGEARRRVEAFQQGQNNGNNNQQPTDGAQPRDGAQPDQPAEHNNDEDDQGLFPRPGEADLMNWAVGGIGH